MRASLLLFAAMLAGCQTWDINHTTVLSPTGQKLCAQHRIPLVTVRAYQPPTYRDRVILYHDNSRIYHGIAYSRVANPIGEGLSLHPTGILREPTTVTYCPLCEKEFLEFLRVPDQRAAIKYVKDAGPIWSPGKGWAKGPYQASLRGDTWTVKCFVEDGRQLTVKVAKEEGRLLSYDVAK
jgi:hypothetical protein